MRTDFHTHFHILAKKKNKRGLAPIYLRLTVNGKRKEYSISRRVQPEFWNTKMEKVMGSNPNEKEINTHINNIRHKLNKIHQVLSETDQPITAAIMIGNLKGENKKPPKLTLEVFREHNSQMDRLSGKSISKSTAKRYWTCYNHIEQFINEELKTDDYPMNDINHQFITKFEYFLKTKRECNHNSALKYVNNFKKIIRIALANEWIDRDPFYNYKVQFDAVEREFLNEEEVQKLIEKDLHLDRLKLVRDMFVFSCYTGLAYSDVKKLSSADITKGIDGGKWIRIKRTKTKSLSSIPLLPVAEEILDRYQDYPEVKDGKYVLPVLSNQKSNAFLKEIAALCGITKPLTTHLARHTFATTITLTNGVPIESVSKMLGHRDLRTTQHYAKIVDRKISDDMKALRKKLEEKAAKDSKKNDSKKKK
ncbi:recombinase [Salegentibacter salinarum]|uniref:Recombinase n=1 Tax=Salegentibacter salinarum TaxID=447422 RepID=A0A2N0U074_9FLAO|nr:site-specific integrase [Salegentibacter salinarum]PKD20405.1 recombinase [Salegentibacter salinarum]SKB85151.1 Site-specific recombinase XerD [Salegentibacter salinarum]